MTVAPAPRSPERCRSTCLSHPPRSWPQWQPSKVIDSKASSRTDITEIPVYWKALGIEIPAGKVIGFTDVDEVTTREGIRLRLEMTGKVYAEGETDSNAWEVHGEPTVRILSDHLATHYTTCGTLLNRIPQLLTAEAGYLTIDSLPQLRYQHN